MANKQAGLISLGNRPAVENWRPADATALAALTLASTDIGKQAHQLDTDDIYQLKSDVGPTWINMRDAKKLGGVVAASFAQLASPTFTGVPAAPTAAVSTNTTQIATTAFVRAEVAALVASSPSTLDTLNELATALGNDPNFATTIANSLALKAPLASPVFSGNVSVGLAAVSPPTMLTVGDTATSSPRGIMSWQANDGTDGARLGFRKNRGTFAAPTAIVSGDTIGRLVAWPYDGTTWLEMGSIAFESTGTIATNRTPTKIVFKTATNAVPSVLTTALILDADQSATFAAGLSATIGAFSSTLASTAHTITSNSASALAVGPNGATNCVLCVDGSVASQADGLKITGNAAGNGVIFTATSSGTGKFQVRPNANSITAWQFQKADGTNVLNVDTTNSRIGIGTATPGDSLHIVGGGLAFDFNQPNGGLRFADSGGTIRSVVYVDANNSIAFRGVSNATGASGGFKVNNDTNAATKFWVQSGGLVGINKTGTFSAQLDIIAASSTIGLNVLAASSQAAGVFQAASGESATTAISQWKDGSGALMLDVAAGGLVRFQGTSSSFPALKRSSATLQVRLADDSGYASLAALDISATGVLKLGTSSDAILSRAGAATLQLGDADAASPVAAQTLCVQGSRGGTDSNVAGGALNLQSGNGTGNATPSRLSLKSPIATTSGTSAQTMTSGLSIYNGAMVLSNYIVANLPSASVCGIGAMVMVTDVITLTAVTGLGLAPTGGGSNKIPAYSDGSQWLLL